MDTRHLLETLHRIVPFPQAGSQMSAADNDVIYPAADFNMLIDRECVRADHYRQGFSVVTFSVARDSDEHRIMQRVLGRRLRLSDAAGWINDNHVGVLLSGTDSEEGIQYFLDSISALLAREDTEMPPYALHIYPRDWYPALAEPWLSSIQDSQAPQAEQAEQAAEVGLMTQTPPNLQKLMSYAMPWWKRSVDVVGALVGLVLLAPLFLAVAAYIKIVSPGPIFFRQKRVGFLGKEFMIWKFRTMEHNADTQKHQHYITELLKNGKPMYKLEDSDPQVIKYGNALRKTGIDEFPQLINVLKGEMSLIGPRPDVLYAVKNYKPWYHARSDAFPGMTGLWQVKGKNNTSYEEMMRLDVAYTRSVSFKTDMTILFSTPLSILAQVRDAILQPRNPLPGYEVKQQ